MSNRKYIFSQLISRLLEASADEDINIHNYLQTESISVALLESTISNSHVPKQMREILKQYLFLKTQPLSGFLSKSYQQKNITNLMVIAARSHYSLLLERDPDEIRASINQQNIDGYTACVYACNNAEKVMRRLQIEIDKHVNNYVIEDKDKKIYETGLYDLDAALLIIKNLVVNTADTLIPNKYGKPAIETIIYCGNSFVKDLPKEGMIVNHHYTLVPFYKQFRTLYQIIVNNHYSKVLNSQYTKDDINYVLTYCRFDKEQLKILMDIYKTYLNNEAYLALETYSRYYNNYDTAYMPLSLRVAELGYISVYIYTDIKKASRDTIEPKDSIGVRSLSTSLQNPNNIAMTRLLLYVGVKPDKWMYLRIKAYAADSNLYYQKAYQQIAYDTDPKATYLDIIPKEILNMIHKYIYFSPLPIVETIRLSDDIRKSHPDSIRLTYQPVTIPLIQERDLPYVQKLGGKMSYLKPSETQVWNINNPTYIQKVDLSRGKQYDIDYYKLFGQFVDPRPGYQDLFVRIHVITDSTIKEDNHNLLYYIDNLENLGPSAIPDNQRYYQSGFYYEIIGWKAFEELDPKLGIAQPGYPYSHFKVGGYDFSNLEMECSKLMEYDYINIYVPGQRYTSLSIHGDLCFTPPINSFSRII